MVRSKSDASPTISWEAKERQFGLSIENAFWVARKLFEKYKRRWSDLERRVSKEKCREMWLGFRPAIVAPKRWEQSSESVQQIGSETM